MCNEKRGWFGVIDMTGDSPKTTYSFNPSALQWWAWVVGKTVGIVIGLWFGVSWVAGGVFDAHLREFHKTAQPAIQRLVESEMAAHERAHVSLERVHEIERHNAGVDQRLENMEKKLEDMDDKLDILVRNGASK